MAARQGRPTWALSRPFCEGGIALCRGTTTAISRYDHALATSDDNLVNGGRSAQGCMHLLLQHHFILIISSSLGQRDEGREGGSMNVAVANMGHDPVHAWGSWPCLGLMAMYVAMNRAWGRTLRLTPPSPADAQQEHGPALPSALCPVPPGGSCASWGDAQQEGLAPPSSPHPALRACPPPPGLHLWWP